MVKNINTGSGTIPENAKWVFIDCSDGDASRWPTNTSSNPDADGHVNFMQPLALDHVASVKWRLLIGQSLAEMLKYDDLGSKKWVLHSWPSGYQFYDHNKGQLHGNVRHDLYLIGSKMVGKFRSPQEFIPHAYWLITDRGENRSNCRCKYCARRPQREVSDAFGLPSQRFAPASSATARVPTNFDRTAARRREKQREAPHVTVRRAPRLLKLPKGPTQFVSPDREGDLRRALGRYQQWARESELVWVKLPHPIARKGADTHAEEAIVFWPGVVEDISFKTEIRPKQSDVVMKDISNSEAGGDRGGKPDDDVPWTVKHKWVYKIQLLVVTKILSCEDDRLLPYQSYAPSEVLLRAVKSVNVDVDSDSAGTGIITARGENEEDAEARLFETFTRFDPLPSSDAHFSEKGQFEAAAGPFAMAIQIASRISRYWTPTHPWECKLMVPSSAPPPGGILTPVNNVLTEKEAEASGSTALGIAAESEVSSRLQQILAPKARQSFGIESQQRFQGLWWGAERIWMGELVRLKFSRYQFAPKGAEVIKKPSGSENDPFNEHSELSQSQASNPGETVRPINNTEDHQAQSQISHTDATANLVYDADEVLLPSAITSGQTSDAKGEDTSMDMDGESDGAASRGIFMRVDGIFLARSTRGRGVGNECRLTGMLYELADESWESGDEAEVYAKSPGSGKPDGKANGKTIATPLTLLNLSPGKSGSPQQSIGDTSQIVSNPVPPTSSSLANPFVSLANKNDDVSGLPPNLNSTSVTPTVTNEGEGHVTKLDNDLLSQPTSSTLQSSLPEPIPHSSIIKELEAGNVIASSGSDIPVLKDVSPLPSENAQPAQRTKTPSSSAPPIFNPGNPSLSSQLSPSPSFYPLPPAPQTYKFRPILDPSFEVHVPLTLLSGRYYPGILQRPLMRPYVTAASQNPEARGNDAYWALECLDAGVFNAVDPTTRVASRWEMFQRAEKEARKELTEYWRNLALQQGNAIVVDVD